MCKNEHRWCFFSKVGMGGFILLMFYVLFMISCGESQRQKDVYGAVAEAEARLEESNRNLLAQMGKAFAETVAKQQPPGRIAWWKKHRVVIQAAP